MFKQKVISGRSINALQSGKYVHRKAPDEKNINVCMTCPYPSCKGRCDRVSNPKTKL